MDRLLGFSGEANSFGKFIIVKNPKIKNIPNSQKPQKISPLADPVVARLFSNANDSGLAMKSLVNSILYNARRIQLPFDSDSTLLEDVSTIVSITPQPIRINPNLDIRSYRLDVEALTNNNEVIALEVQLSKFNLMTERMIIYCQTFFRDSSHKGDDLQDIVKKIPKVIGIGICDFEFLPSCPDFHVLTLVTHYSELSSQLAMNKLQLHTLQLPVFAQKKPDYDNPIDCWLTAFNDLHLGRDLDEVIFMNPDLNNFYKTDPGFKQFVDLFKLTLSDPATIKEYNLWLQEQRVNNSERDVIKAEGSDVAFTALSAFFSSSEESWEKIAKDLRINNIPEDVIQRALKQVKDIRNQNTNSD
ncbi:MAG: Rpn family recombination-promoting nuclease/putative transposase [Deltaproteobacteria bacterium]|jgi:predicted transposase/invertase (TIGR01784 family)|nr:Rpn family recombination-promoting nuclease/putative transposase [Deltaproteobacteria bacterium]